MTGAEAEAFIRAETSVGTAPLVPELRLHLASEVTPLWHATEARLGRLGIEPPFWAFAWAGGQALARVLLDRPALVRGRRVLDLGSGGGIAALAAARAGAAAVVANDLDPLALVAVRLNAALNGVAVGTDGADRIGGPLPDTDLVLVADLHYTAQLAGRLEPWLRGLTAGGVTVLVADGGRNFPPADPKRVVATLDVPTSRDLEDREIRRSNIWRL